MAIKPKNVNLRAYQVGFGDCFLLSIKYSDNSERNVLFDFGTTGLPKHLHAAQGNWMKKVAENIKERCQENHGNLDVVIATHRHKDHISGFSIDKDNSGSGKIIADCKPKLVIQPWTEDPKIPEKATKPVNSLVDSGDVKSFSSQSFVASLDNMQSVSASIVKEVRNLGNGDKFSHTIKQSLQEQIEFIGDDNISNRSAVENLAKMGKNVYVHYGYDLNADLKDILPNVKVKVLGPPTIEQHKEIKNEAREDDEFWILQAMNKNFWGMQSATSELTEKLIAGEVKLFPNAVSYKKSVPSHDRWFVRQLRKIRAEQLLNLVRILDDAMNNTSLILLFEIGDKKLLFPGDAQIENWEYSLKFADDKNKNLDLLKDTFLYKVGHHGSRNATPRTLWETFANKKTAGQPEAGGDSKKVLKSVVSTMGAENGKHKHGDPANNSEVPRDTLVKELETFSEYHTTQILVDTDKFWDDIEIEIN